MEENKNMMSPEQEQSTNTSAQTEEERENVVESTEEAKKATELQEESFLETEEKDDLEREMDDDHVAESDEEELKKMPDYTKFSVDELISRANEVINNYVFGESKRHIDVIKNTFYAKINGELEKLRAEHREAGKEMSEFVSPFQNQEDTFKTLIKIFKDKRAKAVAQLEKEREQNYNLKIQIINEIAGLVNSTDSFGVTFKAFKDLQEKWKEIKEVPSRKLRELNTKYQLVLNQFYDYLKINKELHELDLKKNQEQKENLCVRAEELIGLKNAKTAFKELQDLHQQWKDIGRVSDEVREALWERFKQATKEVNEKFQDYQKKQKEVRQENLVLKTQICEKVDEALSTEYQNPREWDEASKSVEQLQKDWKKIGMVPAKDNDAIYRRFMEACNRFFKTKNEYFKELKNKQIDNLKAKNELIEKIEKLIEDGHWQSNTNKVIQIQKEWKNIGVVPKRKSNAVWKRFRAACDDFFNKKNEHFKEIHGDEKENLELKRALIKEIESYKPHEDSKESLKDLKTFQDKWAEIGFVPFKNKNEIQEAYRSAINKQFDALNLEESERDLSRLKIKLDSYLEMRDAKELIFGERNKVASKIKRVETDIQQLENNIGFFSSGTAKGLLKEYENKIIVNKKNLEALRNKIRLIDKYIED